MWKNIVEPDSTQMKIWRMRVACWITKTTQANPEYAILIAFPLKQWLQKRVSMLRDAYFSCLVMKLLRDFLP
jgi:hypothetical protein